MAAKGQATRQANKERRREKILAEARSLIAEEGFDALTINQLAKRSGVTIPTVHNLLGKKNDIVLALFQGLVDSIDQVLAEPELADPIAASEAFLDSLLSLYGSDEVFYRAAFLGGERLECADKIAGDTAAAHDAPSDRPRRCIRRAPGDLAREERQHEQQRGVRRWSHH